jgi:cullin 1
MGILLQFNNSTEYTQEQLQTITGLAPETLNGNLNLLVKAKVLLLQDGKYILNSDFKSKKIRVNLNLAIRSETKAEIEETHKTVEEDRKIVIQVLCILFGVLTGVIGVYCPYHED